MKSTMVRGRAAGIAGVTVLAMVALAACGGSSSTDAAGAASTPTATSSAEASAPAGQGNRGGIDEQTQTQITACLKAAGITVPTMGARPSGGARPTGAPPSGAPGDGTGTPPTGAPGGGTGGPGGGGIFGSEEAQAALKACGITLPERPAGAPSGAPTAGNA